MLFLVLVDGDKRDGWAIASKMYLDLYLHYR